MKRWIVLLSLVAFVSAQGQDTLSRYILTPKAGPAPRINGAKVFGVRPAHPILYTIAVSGDRPMQFLADKLPPGVKLDAASGRISGEIAKKGTYIIHLTAQNKKGKATRALKIVVGEDIAPDRRAPAYQGRLPNQA